MAMGNTKEERGGAAVAERPPAVSRPTDGGRLTGAVAKSAPDTDRFRPRRQNWEATSTSRHQMGSRRPKGLGRAKFISHRSPEAAAVAVASFIVTLLCLYVGAYARVTAEGFEKERLMESLRAARAEERALHAEVSKLKMPDSVSKRAKMLGLIPGDAPGLNLVAPPAGSSTTPVETGDTPKETP